ncbi:MAG: FHA domain-containing protein [Spirochaetales bacterium]|nr:FHA domain-containing protein [Spirochaetales bacterium]
MSLGMRIIMYGCIGIASGILSWPFAELVIFFQKDFPNLLLFSMATGVSIGIFMGGCFGMSEGIISMSKAKMIPGILTGILFGAIGGAAGLLLGQFVLLLIGTTFFNSNLSIKTLGTPLSKAVGWALFGALVGMGEGIRSRSFAKIRNGLIGGCIGGIFGGLAFEYLKLLLEGNPVARLAGLVLLGLCIGVFYGFIEIKMTDASLFLLNGSYKGREYPLTQQLTSIGSSPLTVVNLEGYKNIGEVHSEITKEKDGFYLTQAGTKTNTFVNDEQTAKKKLENGDIIRIGTAQFLFKKKERG